MHIDIFSDTICPWCFIGKQRIERALQSRPQDMLTITWRAYQLNPDMPAEGMERGLYLKRKFGGAENAAMIYGRIRKVGEEEQIGFEFDKIERTPNTLASHRLIRYAAERGHQDDIVQALFEAYFREGRDIGDHGVLSEIAEAAGLNGQAVGRFLKSSDLTSDLASEDNAARHIGIQGVPCFIFNGRHVISGAQPAEAFIQLFDVIRAEEELAQSKNA